ncbi:MAG: decarboxylating 6-phosphogluconate dehydrogenase [Elusimicrobia bacterium]|nr:decarboxylating 6-phosphogluconate dehydrogenase [Elusimicrobiota bacterium]
MRLAMVGLGRMGLNMSVRLIKGGHQVVGFDPSAAARARAARSGLRKASSLEDAVRQLKAPRVVWLMIPAGQPVWDAVDALAGLLRPGDLVVDGGNSRYKDAARHDRTLARCGAAFMDVGVSGGIWGLKEGYCLMAGGAAKDFRRLQPALKTLAPKDGYALVGPTGAGHFTKMVHNGVEYALMQGYAEGLALLRGSPFPLDLHGVCRLWNQGSVVRSWLLELAEEALRKDPTLKSLRGWVADSGEGRWTVLDAVELGIPAPTITLSLFERFRSRMNDSFQDKVLAALRQEFGGHAVRRAK